MANDIFSKVNLDNFSSLDLSRTTNMALSVQAEIEENNKLMKQAADEALVAIKNIFTQNIDRATNKLNAFKPQATK